MGGKVMLPAKRRGEFFLYLGRVLVLLILLSVLLPKLIVMCNHWLSSLLHSDQRPHGSPLRVETIIPREFKA